MKFYVSELVFLDKSVAHLMRYKEISNPRHRFDSTRNWDIFCDHELPSGWNGMPSHWVRLFHFPKRRDRDRQRDRIARLAPEAAMIRIAITPAAFDTIAAALRKCASRPPSADRSCADKRVAH